ncbi:hypothetical protein [Thermosporothrix hazakensis]|uniref:hypothetical protein n=1 Tax=Thermosporothrix hazakensis TaxID=644383 RepID=UPI001477192C|nr:hypothetical protein [Thermosporothrix hazakensis]
MRVSAAAMQQVCRQLTACHASTIRLDAREQLLLTADLSSTMITVMLPAAVEEIGTHTLSLRALRQLLQQGSGPELTLSLAPRDEVTFLPVAPLHSSEPELLSLPVSSLHVLMRSVVPFVCRDFCLYRLCHVVLQAATENSLWAVGSDGFCAVRRRVQGTLSQQDPTKHLLLQVPFVRALSRFSSCIMPDAVCLYERETCAVVDLPLSYGRLLLRAHFSWEQYPDIEARIPTGPFGLVDRKALLYAVQALQALHDSPLLLEVEGSTQNLRLYLMTDTSPAAEMRLPVEGASIPADWDEGALLNPWYLVRMLRAFPDTQLSLHLSHPEKPFALRDETGDCTCLLMPMGLMSGHLDTIRRTIRLEREKLAALAPSVGILN